MVTIPIQYKIKEIQAGRITLFKIVCEACGEGAFYENKDMAKKMGEAHVKQQHTLRWRVQYEIYNKDIQ